MRKFFGLLNLLLCFELIVSPIAPHLSVFGENAYAETCSAGFQYDSNLNRCLTSTQTANIINATKNCAQGDQACYRSNAENVLKEKEASGEADKAVKNMGFVSTVMNAAAVAVPVTMASAGLAKIDPKDSTCAAASYWALIGGGASLFVGDNLANFLHKRRLKEIEKDWKKIVSPGAASETDTDQQKVNATESQSQAFEMLARSEDSMAKAAKMKSVFFGIAAGAFAAAAGIAAFEMISPATYDKVCKTTPPTDAGAAPGTTPDATTPAKPYDGFKGGNGEQGPDMSRVNGSIRRQHYYNLSQTRNLSEFYIINLEMNSLNSSPSIDEYEKIQKYVKETKLDNIGVLSVIKEVALKALKEVNPISKAHASEVTNTVVTGAAAGAGYLVGQKFQKQLYDQFLVYPVTRVAVGGVLAGWSLIMYKHAASQKEASTNRAKLLRKMRDDFKSASGAINMCQPADRSDPGKPECYCYTSDGQKNSSRTSSQICIALFAGANLNPSSNYLSSTASVKGCINSSNQFDETCACKASNSCMKAVGSSIAGMNIGTFSLLSSGLTPVNAVANGSLDAANVDAASLANNAVKLLAAKDKIAGKSSKEARDTTKKAENAFQQAALTASAGAPSGLASNDSSLPSNPAEAVKLLEKEIKDENKITTVGRSGTRGGSANPSDSFNLDFGGLTASELNNEETQVAEVMKQNIDFGQNDINPAGSNTNIFEVLSNRYQRSGMRRLFDEKGTTKPDQANKTDISQ